MIIDWNGIYQNSEYYVGDHYSNNGIVRYTAVVVTWLDAVIEGVDIMTGKVVYIIGKIKH